MTFKKGKREAELIPSPRANPKAGSADEEDMLSTARLEKD